MNLNLVQAKLEPIEAQAEGQGVIGARRGLVQQHERFVRIHLVPRLERRSSTVNPSSPLEHEEAAAVDGLETDDPEKIGVPHRHQLLHLALQGGERHAIGQRFGVQCDQAHFALALRVVGAKDACSTLVSPHDCATR